MTAEKRKIFLLLFSYLEQLEGSALLQLLEHGPQMPPAAPGLLQICLIVSTSKQGPRGICKVCLEGKQVLQGERRQRLQDKMMGSSQCAQLQGMLDHGGEQIAPLTHEVCIIHQERTLGNE